MDSPSPFSAADTTADAHHVQTAIYARMGGPARLAIAFRLTSLARETAKAGIRARHPSYDRNEVDMAYRRLVLGDALVQAVWPHRPLIDP